MLCSSDETNCITDLWHVLLVVALWGDFGGLLSKYPVAVRIRFLSLHTWTEALELELWGRMGRECASQQRLNDSKQTNKLSCGRFTPEDHFRSLIMKNCPQDKITTQLQDWLLWGKTVSWDYFKNTTMQLSPRAFYDLLILNSSREIFSDGTIIYFTA